MYQLFYEASGETVLLQWRAGALCDNLKAAGISSQVTKPACQKYDVLHFAMIKQAALERIRKIGDKHGDELYMNEHNGTGNHFRSSFEAFSEVFKPEKKAVPGEVVPEKKADSVVVTTKFQAGNLLNEKSLKLAAIDKLKYSEAFSIIADQNPEIHRIYMGV